MISLLGINHKTASLEVRELFSFSKEQIVPFSEQLLRNCGISEIVVVSTCNRTEIYVSQDKYGIERSKEILLKQLHLFKNIDKDYSGNFFYYANDDAVRHLFEVTSGIDSMVIGEDQIIGQVKDAYIFCTEAALTDAVLMRLFQKSFEAGKRVRTETDIRLGATSVSYVAVEVCKHEFPDLRHQHILLVGAGETGALVVQNLAKRGIKEVSICNRTEERAAKLAKKYGDQVVNYSQFQEHLHKFDIIITATNSPKHLIEVAHAKKAQKQRGNKPQVYIDLAVPRNISESVACLPDTALYGVDDMQDIIESNTDNRKQCIESASKIIDEVLQEYMEWLDSRSLRPIINEITTSLRRINTIELANYQKFSDKDEKEIVNDYANHLTQKYARMLIKNLKEVSNNGKDTKYLQVVHDLFKLG